MFSLMLTIQCFMFHKRIRKLLQAQINELIKISKKFHFNIKASNDATKLM